MSRHGTPYSHYSALTGADAVIDRIQHHRLDSYQDWYRNELKLKSLVVIQDRVCPVGLSRSRVYPVPLLYTTYPLQLHLLRERVTDYDFYWYEQGNPHGTEEGLAAAVRAYNESVSVRKYQIRRFIFQPLKRGDHNYD